jgi:hypothetical protein
MKSNLMSDLNEEDFRRLTGIKRQTFERMIEILSFAEEKKKKLGGKPNTLDLEDRLRMALSYWREYRTFFQIASAFAVSESTCYRHIRWIENVLVKHSDLALLGRRVLREPQLNYPVILLDATESPIERPKKTKTFLFRQEEAPDTEGPSDC